MPTPQHIKQRKYWRSRLKESAYGTSPSTGTPANYKQVLAKDNNLAAAQPQVQDNAAYATGYPRPTEQWLSAHDVSFSHGQDISGNNYLYESQCGVTFDDGSTVTNLATAPNRLNSWRTEIINQLLLDDGFRPGAALFQGADATTGEVRSEMLVGDQSFNIV